MEKYQFLKEVGKGTYGSVWRAIDKQTGDVVAIKILKKHYYSLRECLNLTEVKALRKLNHENIVKLKQVVQENNLFYMVFEYMECSLYQLMKERKSYFSEAEIKNWCFQVLQGLAFMHQDGYFHRDLKPDNLLINNNVIKIADFGLAREIDSNPPYTDYVVTRWYRAPELMLRSNTYSSKIDMWAMGAIMAELFTLEPLFPGMNEADEMCKICEVIGSPNEDSWADGLDLARTLHYQFPQDHGVPLSLLIPSASEDAINLISSLCSWDPCKRPTAAEALQHPFFRNCYHIPQHFCSNAAVTRTPPSVNTRRSDAENKSNCACPQLYTHFGTSVQCKNCDFLKGTTIPPRKRSGRTPGKRSSRTDCGVDDRVQKLANKMIAPGSQFVEQQMPLTTMSNCTCPKLYSYFGTSVQCKHELINEDANKNCDLLKGSARQVIYVPPRKRSGRTPGKRSSRTDCGVDDTVEKLANMMIDPGSQFMGQQMPLPTISNCTCPQLYTYFGTSVYCKHELINEDVNKNSDLLKGTARQVMYVPPRKRSGRTPGKRSSRTDCGVDDTVEKFENRMIALESQFVRQQMPPPTLKYV